MKIGSKKKIMCNLVLPLLFVFVLTGCAKCISTETSTVKVKVTDKYYKAAHTTMYYNPAACTYYTLRDPAVYEITVEYDGKKYEFSGRDTYDKYSKRIGEYVNGTLRTKKYDNGKTIRYIVDLE